MNIALSYKAATVALMLFAATNSAAENALEQSDPSTIWPNDGHSSLEFSADGIGNVRARVPVRHLGTVIDVSESGIITMQLNPDIHQTSASDQFQFRIRDVDAPAKFLAFLLLGRELICNHFHFQQIPDVVQSVSCSIDYPAQPNFAWSVKLFVDDFFDKASPNGN